MLSLTPWQIDGGGGMETMEEFIFLGSKITADCDWSHKIKRCLLFGRSRSVSHSVMSNSLRPRGLQHARLPSPSPTPRAYSNSCPSSQHAIQQSHPVAPFSSCLQSFPASGSFPVSQFFASGGQSIGVSASASVSSFTDQKIHALSWLPYLHPSTCLPKESHSLGINFQVTLALHSLPLDKRGVGVGE